MYKHTLKSTNIRSSYAIPHDNDIIHIDLSTLQCAKFVLMQQYSLAGQTHGGVWPARLATIHSEYGTLFPPPPPYKATLDCSIDVLPNTVLWASTLTLVYYNIVFGSAQIISQSALRFMIVVTYTKILYIYNQHLYSVIQ